MRSEQPQKGELSPTELEKLTQVLKALGLAVNNISLYTAKHRIAYMSLEQSHQLLDDYLSLHKELNFSFVEEAFLAENIPMTVENPLIENFKNHLKKWKIQSITYSSGLTLEELLAFFELIIRRPEGEEVDEIKPLMVDKKISHILVNKAVFVKTGEGISAKALKGLAGGKRGKKDILVDPDKLEGFFIGLSKANVKVRSKIIEVLEKSPDTLAEDVIQAVQSKYEKEVGGEKDLVTEELAACMDRIGEILEKEAYSGKIKTRDQLATLFQNLETSLKKQLNEKPNLKSKKSDAFDQVQLRLCKIKVGILTSEYDKQKKSLDHLAELAKNLLTDDEENKRILPLLKNRLSDEGMSETSFREMLEKAGVRSPRKEDRIKDVKLFIKETIGNSLSKINVSEEEKKKAETELLNKIEKSVTHQVELETKEWQVENAVLHSRIDKTEAILKSVADAIVVVDPKGEVVFVNPAAEELLNIKKEHLLGKHVLEEIKETQMITLSKDQMGEEGVFESTEVEIRGTRDTVKTLRKSVGMIHNKNGHMVGTVSVLSDVSKQKQLEQIKSDFVSNVSHELRTPLVSIQKSIELILNEQTGKINEDQKHFLEISNRNVSRLMRLINDILDISKMEAGKQGLRVQTVDVEKLVKESVAGLQVWAQSKGIILDLQLDENLPNVLWDFDKVIQTVINFISNAIKFTPEKGVIEILVRQIKGAKDFEKIKGASIALDQTTENPLTEEDAYILFTIKDSGPGLSKEDALKIFDKFFQIKHTSGAKIEGTGLGLPIARQIIELHHGKLWLESQKHEGATFRFVLPVRDNSLIFS